MTYKLIDDDFNSVATCSNVRDAVSLAKDIAAGRMIKRNHQTCIRVYRMKGNESESVCFIVAYDNGDVVAYNIDKIRRRL